MIADFKKVLSRFPKIELGEIISKYSDYAEFEDDQDDVKISTKEGLIDIYLNKNKGVLTTSELAKLELEYTKLHSSKRLWTCLQLDILASEMVTLSAEELQEALIVDMSLYFYEVNVSVMVCDDTGWYWMGIHCVDLPSPSTRSVSETMFAVYVPTHPYLVHTKVKVGFVKRLDEAFMKAFQATSINHLSLTGRNVQGLLQMTAYHQDPAKADSLMPSRLSVPAVESEAQHRNLTRGDLQRRIARQRQIDSQLGDKDFPELQNITYSLETRFLGFNSERFPKLAPQIDSCRRVYEEKTTNGPQQAFRCEVRFSGPDVLEGYRSAMESGFGKMPLPKYVRNIRRKGQNHFLIRQKSMNARVT